jgi:hypothetical protein
VDAAHSQLCTDFHNAEAGQKDRLKWYKAIWKLPKYTFEKLEKRMQEINPIVQKISDLRGRLTALRGYL